MTVNTGIFRYSPKGDAMKMIRTMLRDLALMLIVMIMLPAGLQAQDAGEPVPDNTFSREELAQMLAPIALYPDSLLAQILMAATYPIEVVEAERWIRQNKDLKGDALDNALQGKTWDPSVKSLCHYPDVLFAMSDRLDQTRTMGDAYLAQQDDVMATVQELRRRADEQGNLKTTKEQKVIVEQEIVRIEPTNPEVVYLPVYNPVYVYGPWWYPAYPPWYWYYPPGVVVTGPFITFGPSFFVGFNLFSWCWFDWHSNYIYVDYYRTRHFHHYHDGYKGDHQYWKHDTRHRRGVAYRDRRTSDRFGERPSQRSRPDRAVRGYPSDQRRDRSVARTRDRSEGRSGSSEPGRLGRQRTQERTEQRIGPAGPRERTGRERTRSSIRRESPFGGVGNGNFERRAQERGVESRRSGEVRQQGGTTQRQNRSIQPQGGAPGGSHKGGGQGGGSRSGSQSGGSRGGSQGGGFRR